MSTHDGEITMVPTTTELVSDAVHEAAQIAASRFPDLQINVKHWENKEGKPGWSIVPGNMAAYLTVQMSGVGAKMRWWYDINQQLQMIKYFGPEEEEGEVHLQVAMTLEAKLFE